VNTKRIRLEKLDQHYSKTFWPVKYDLPMKEHESKKTNPTKKLRDHSKVNNQFRYFGEIAKDLGTNVRQLKKKILARPELRKELANYGFLIEENIKGNPYLHNGKLIDPVADRMILAAFDEYE
jgi:hypothetical protein